MGTEAYYSRSAEASDRTVADLVGLLTAAGYPCCEEADEWGRRVAFEGFESYLDLTVEDEAVVFATFDMAILHDPPDLFEAVERVFVEDGWDLGADDES
ncbi:hypothetical protein [Paludisphaera mucosa]|uniref:Uncharacterized protein n=1 Tax=Paludisphaera mucosa TaxID=3030827 RepID=A0ABT6FGY9_9BACT|nr:hypothetical protein [Paludisphaera mucosa]MDG3006847.1 hypothetical protein [Paludisphaera mucosa]